MVKCLITMIENCFRGMQTEIRNIELKVLLLNVLLLVVIILSSAVVSSYEDSWNIRQGIYVWFITLTTVGFGDFVPTKMMADAQPNSLIIPGLCFMSGVVDAMVEYANKGDVKVRCCPSSCFCFNNTSRSSPEENEIETVDTQNHPLNNLGFEEATTQKETINFRQDTAL